MPDTEWTSGDLLGHLERRDRFFVLDVRNRDEYEKFRLEGRSPLPSLNVPYFEMLELGGKDEMVDSVAAYMDVVPSTISYEPIRDGQVFPVGLHQLEALHIPGHTLGLVAFRLEDRYLFAGDSIFIRSIAWPDLGG